MCGCTCESYTKEELKKVAYPPSQRDFIGSEKIRRSLRTFIQVNIGKDVEMLNVIACFEKFQVFVEGIKDKEFIEGKDIALYKEVKESCPRSKKDVFPNISDKERVEHIEKVKSKFETMIYDSKEAEAFKEAMENKLSKFHVKIAQ